MKSHYRALLAENQPDKLIARGVPEEFVTIAIEKVASINEAYDGDRQATWTLDEAACLGMVINLPFTLTSFAPVHR